MIGSESTLTDSSMSRSAPNRGARLGVLILSFAGATRASAQSLASFDARLDVTTAGTASVTITMRFASDAARMVRFSLYPASVRAVDERVGECGERPGSLRRIELDGRHFPALESALPTGCAELELRYAALDPSRIPLLVPDVGIAEDGRVDVAVQAAAKPSGRTFPRLSWDQTAVGRRRLRQVPAVIILPLPGQATELDPRADGRAPGFGWTLWGFFVGAVAFLAAFFLWARLTAGRASGRPTTTS